MKLLWNNPKASTDRNDDDDELCLTMAEPLPHYVCHDVGTPEQRQKQGERFAPISSDESPSSTNSSSSSLSSSASSEPTTTIMKQPNSATLMEEGDCAHELMDMLQEEMGSDRKNQNGNESLMSSPSSGQLQNLTRSLQQQTQQYKQESEHRRMAQVDAENLEFTYRPITVTDRDRVKELHEEWFPVRYQEEFYDDLAENHLSGNPLFTLLATHKRIKRRQSHNCSSVDVESDATDQIDPGSSPTTTTTKVKRTWTQRWLWRRENEQQMGQQERSLVQEVATISNHSTDSHVSHDDIATDRVFAHDVDDDDDAPSGNIDTRNFHSEEASVGAPILQPPQHEIIDDDVIAGCVVGSFMPLSRMSLSLQDLLVSDPLRYRHLFYIMTLGTVSHYRGAGLGTTLVEHCIAKVQEHPTCGTLYLHVLTENQTAIRLYERLGFYRVHEIPDYYDIDGVKHPCYLYAKYFHGNRGHLAIHKVLGRAVWSFCKKIWQLANEPSPFPVPSLPTAMFASNLLSPASSASHVLAAAESHVSSKEQSRSIEYGAEL